MMMKYILTKTLGTKLSNTLNIGDEIKGWNCQNYKTTRMKYILTETLGMKLFNTQNIGDEKCIFSPAALVYVG